MKSISKRGKFWAVVFAGIGLAVVVVIVAPRFSRSTADGPGLSWKTQAELARSMQPGPLTRLKLEAMRVIPGLRRWYPRRRLQIAIESRLLTLPAAVEPGGLGAAQSTNANGMRGWMLNPAQLKSLRQGLKSIPGAASASVLRLTTVSGIAGQMQSVSEQPPPRTVFAVDLMPVVSADRVKIALGAMLTETHSPQSQGEPLIMTNFDTACSATVLDGGGLLIQSDGRAGEGGNYWLLVAPTLIDPAGNRIHPESKAR